MDNVYVFTQDISELNTEDLKEAFLPVASEYVKSKVRKLKNNGAKKETLGAYWLLHKACEELGLKN